MKKFFSFLGLLCYCQLMYAQTPSAGINSSTEAVASIVSVAKVRITGTVTDASTSDPVPYATAALMQAGSKTPLDGAVADENGKFTINKVETGEYRIAISFLGYEDKVINNIKVSDSKADIILGTVKLNPAVQELRSCLSY